CIQQLRSIRLPKAAHFRIERVAANILNDLRSHLAPAADWPIESELFSRFDGTIESHPYHDLGVSKVDSRASKFPHAAVGVRPDFSAVLKPRKGSARAPLYKS